MDTAATPASPADPYDVVVVGGSVAGLSAALVLGRARFRVAVVDAGHPVNEGVAHSHGFLTQDGTPPADLVATGRDEVARYGVDLVDDEVAGVMRRDDLFGVLRAAGEPLLARRLVLATGMRIPLPDLPGLEEIWGGDAANCPFCHGWEAQDRPIAVIGDPAFVPHLSGLLTQWSDDVLAFLPEGADAAEIEALGAAVERRPPVRLLVEGGHLRGVEVGGGDVIAREALFVARMAEPASPLPAALGCDVDDLGFPVVDELGLTSVPGVWAVGNAVTMGRGLVESAASGSMAARAVTFDLIHARVPAPT
ncbi:NAD(P)/FAD-dependent oxidoreductase [Iamia sp. SCSIO 61187]|uniref:NAD(P)/FAD-dependent oxidoreductase n=1 Tax=Iamia sp. SCSIO 61187 TaxID=2722752 RepID=UPI001C632358|nr:NAD(P)/FAD-dependent oxidoreductase [Iamia sp. SCSIO 61187]QYG91339.1 NAD(P)/FAD-dependent oxidoreductase [Iamia sp. SCSIO 61187]